MIRTYRIACVLAVLSVFSSCKNEVDKTTDGDVETTMDSQEKKEPIVLTEEDKKQINSVMTKLMVTQDVKTFTSTLVSARMTDMLSKEDGPYTVFAPSNEAFNKLPKEEMNNLSNPKNSEQLTELLKGHIVTGSMDSVSIVQAIRKGGSVSLEALDGKTLTVTQEGDDLIVTNQNGTSGVIGKSDISGSNGVVHVLDAVLN